MQPIGSGPMMLGRREIAGEIPRNKEAIKLRVTVKDVWSDEV